MKWITRKDVKVDRVACPWLNHAILGSSVGVLLVEERELLGESKRQGATPFDAPKIEAIKLNRRAPRCSFEAIIEDHAISDSAEPRPRPYRASSGCEGPRRC
jgi:hypothetical protein